MFGIEEKIARLGQKLSDAFSARARHYFEEGTKGTIPKERAIIIGAVLGEVAAVILNATKEEE